MQKNLNRDLAAVGKTPKFDYVHVVIFYTAGVITTEVLAKDGVHDFVPYAVKNGLYDRVPGWQHNRAVCDNDWLPYLQGKTTFQDALTKMAKDF